MSEARRLIDLLESIKNYRVLVLGETILDEYEYVIPMGKPPKEPIIAARHDRSERFAGGAVIVANVVAALCKDVHLVTSLSEIDYSFVAKELKENVTPTCVTHGRRSIIKRRFIDPVRNRKMFEVYHIDESPLKDDADQNIRKWLRSGFDADLVIVADFGHGLISPTTVNMLTGDMRSNTFVAATVQTNAGNFGFNLATKYQDGIDYLCIDETEARLALCDRLGPVGDLGLRLNIADVWAVTRGSHGCVVGGQMRAGYSAEQEQGYSLPSVAKDVIDTVGTGDAFLAVTAPLVKAGAELPDIGLLGNIAGAIKSNIVGQRTYVTKASLIQAIGELCPDA